MTLECSHSFQYYPKKPVSTKNLTLKEERHLSSLKTSFKTKNCLRTGKSQQSRGRMGQDLYYCTNGS